MADRIYSQQNKYFFFGFFIFVSLLSYMVLKPYISLIILAFLTATLFRPLYLRLYNVFLKKNFLAVFTTLIVILLTFLIPLLFIGKITIDQVNAFDDNIQELIDVNAINEANVIGKVNDYLDKVPFVEYQVTPEKIQDFTNQILKPVGSYIAGNAVNWSSSALNIVTSFIVFLTFLISFLSAQPLLLKFIKQISPLDDDIDNVFINRFIDMSSAMVKGTFVVAIIQGLVSGLLLLFLNVDYALFWGLLSTFSAIIPLGTGIVNIPLGLFYIVSGHPAIGLTILLFNLVVTSNLDNLLRPKLVAKSAKLPHALVLVGVLGGLKLFGFFGFIYGPVIMILLTTTIDVYLKYYRARS